MAGRLRQTEILGDVVLDAGIEAAGEIGQRPAGMGDQEFQRRMTLQSAAQDEAGDGDRGLEGEAQCQQQRMAGVGKQAVADAVVRVHEHEQSRARRGRPDRLEVGIVQPLPAAGRADDDAAHVRITRKALELGGAGLRPLQRQHAETQEPAGRRRADRLEVFVERSRQRRRLGRLDEIDPRIGRAHDRHGDVVLVHEGKLAAHLVKLAADRPPRRGRGVGLLVRQDDQPLPRPARDDARDLPALPQQGDVARQVHVGVDVDQRWGHDHHECSLRAGVSAPTASPVPWSPKSPGAPGQDRCARSCSRRHDRRRCS